VSDASGTLPGTGFAEQAIALMRAMFTRDEIRDPSKVGAGVYLWDCFFEQRDRRFACRLAKLPLELAERDWRELALVEQSAIVTALHRVELWCARHRRALDRLHIEREAG
jgi:hypothetical protein